MLKHACRARHTSETIHPDASDPEAGRKVPKAIFDIETGGHLKSLNWNRDAESSKELSTIAIFDTLCARAYLDEQDVAYLPYGLDSIENLGQRVLPELSRLLNSEISSINADTTPFSDLQGNTTVGKLIASLGEDTKPENVIALATLTTDEISRLNELERTLAENDPKAKAKAVRLSAQRVDGLISRIDSASAYVDDLAVRKLKSCDDETEAAIQAEDIAAENFRAGESLLPGTGDQRWKNLFESARRFSVELAYPGESFPHVCQGAWCPLCQQPLDQEAAKRMQRFEEFVKQDTAKVSAEKRQQRMTAEQKVAQASLGFALDAAMTEEFRQLDATLLQAAEAFEKKVGTRRKWMLDALKAHSWDSLPFLMGTRVPV